MRQEIKISMWEKLTSFENLYLAAKEAQRGKRFRPEVAQFNCDLASSLIELGDELRSGRYQPGPYHTFTIYEPARRYISAAPYRDRVVHHALCQVIEPLFERSFIFDSYANRVGKGTHKALDRCTEYCRAGLVASRTKMTAPGGGLELPVGRRAVCELTRRDCPGVFLPSTNL